MIAQRAVMVLTYSEDDSDVYEFGKLSKSDEALAQWSKEFREKLVELGDCEEVFDELL